MLRWGMGIHNLNFLILCSSASTKRTWVRTLFAGRFNDRSKWPQDFQSSSTLRQNYSHNIHECGVLSTMKDQGATEPRVFIGAIDAGTTSSRFLIFDKSGTPVASHQIELSNEHAHSGCAK